jgi:hypothetical protein
LHAAEQKSQEWREATITLAGSGASRPGKELANSGLGYWICEADAHSPAMYSPTHILSGYAASAATFYSEAICQQFLVELSKLMNWNQPLETLVQDANYKTEQFNALAKKFWIEDAGATAGGGRW